MEDNSYIYAIILGYLVNLWIMYAIISSATRARKLLIESMRQTKILIIIAKNNGITDDQLKEIEALKNSDI